MAKTEYNQVNLQLLLEGPFALRDNSAGNDDDCKTGTPNCTYDIFVPDLLDSHFVPGFQAEGDGLDLPTAGKYILAITDYKPGKTQAKGSPLFDCCHRSDNMPASGAYVILNVPKPDEIWGISGVDAIIHGDGANEGPKSYCTRAVLRYKNINLDKVSVTGMGLLKTKELGLVPIGSDALLYFSMIPNDLPTVEHGMMAYRAAAKMVGFDRYLEYTLGGNIANRIRVDGIGGRQNNCRAVLIKLDPPPKNSATGRGGASSRKSQPKIYKQEKA